MHIEEVNLDDVEVETPTITFQDKVSFRIARWILIVFTIICILTCGLIFYAFEREDATFEGIVLLIQFPLSTIMSLVTLAVGYYLGDKD